MSYLALLYTVGEVDLGGRGNSVEKTAGLKVCSYQLTTGFLGLV